MDFEYFENKSGWSLANRSIKNNIKRNERVQQIRQKLMKDKIKKALSKLYEREDLL